MMLQRLSLGMTVTNKKFSSMEMTQHFNAPPQ